MLQDQSSSNPNENPYYEAAKENSQENSNTLDEIEGS